VRLKPRRTPRSSGTMLAMGNSATLADRLLVPPSMQNGGGGRRGGWEGQTLSVPNQGGTYTNSYSSHGHFGGGFPVQAPPSPYFQPMRGGWGGYGFPPSSPGPAPSIYSTPTNQHHHARHMDIYSSVGEAACPLRRCAPCCRSAPASTDGRTDLVCGKSQGR